METPNASEWEKAFDTLDKRVFSVEAIGGYDFGPLLKKYARKESFILDYGCGKGHGVIKLRDEGYKNSFGTDPSEFLLKGIAPPASDFIKLMSNGVIPFKSETFDFVYTSGVLHHISWGLLPEVLAELKRVLKPGGVFVYIEPRNSLARKLGHTAVLSPLSKLSKNATALAECLRAEWPTYYPWLVKEEAEFAPLCQKLGFSKTETHRKLFTKIGVLRRGNDSDSVAK
jgi:SAM-dependent methyltransferase